MPSVSEGLVNFTIRTADDMFWTELKCKTECRMGVELKLWTKPN